MIVAVTATRYSLTKAQVTRFMELITELDPRVFLHGGCKGGDFLCGLLVKQLLPRCVVWAHPANDVPGWMAPYGSFSDKVAEEEPALQRNRTMVDTCNLLLGLPQDFTEKTRSGTWATIRYARRWSETVPSFSPTGK